LSQRSRLSFRTRCRQVGPTSSLRRAFIRRAKLAQGSGSLNSRRMRARHLYALAALTLLAGILRFATLDVQSFWFDESVTVGLMRKDLGGMLSALPDSESTPPLYYLLAWIWAKVFGTGEVGLRSLSALFGTATVPVAYAVGAQIATRRVGLCLAALAAVNPLLFHYSQEARSYALLVLLTSLSLLFFARALDEPRARTLGWWAATSAAALATHYFAVFVVAFEAAWLLRESPERRRVLAALGGVAAAGLALAPLAIHQRSNDFASFIRESSSVVSRIGSVPKQFLVGLDLPAQVVLAIAAALIALVALWPLLALGSWRERQGARVAAAVAAVGVGIPMLLALVGVDYLNGRNVIAAWLPAAAVAATGFGARRAGSAGIALLVALMALSLGVIVAVLVDPSYQRDDWRGAAKALGEPGEPRAIAATPGTAIRVLRIYLDRPLGQLPAAGAAVREIDVLSLPLKRRGRKRPAPPPPAGRRPPVPGFGPGVIRKTDTYTLTRFRAARPILVQPAMLEPALGGRGGALLLERR
jgi:mannosyltransferase